jgi:hypothetical protein
MVRDTHDSSNNFLPVRDILWQRWVSFWSLENARDNFAQVTHINLHLDSSSILLSASTYPSLPANISCVAQTRILNLYPEILYLQRKSVKYQPVLRIRDILVRIRIRRFVPLTNGSGLGSCYFRQWPSRWRWSFFACYFLKLHLHHFLKIKSRKEITKQ